jgi:hypothetical protein
LLIECLFHAPLADGSPFAASTSIWASKPKRQWSAIAIARTTPLLLGLFFLATLLANSLFARHDLSIQIAAWYPKPLPTFSNALALVRSPLWAFFTSQTSQDEPAMIRSPAPFSTFSTTCSVMPPDV